MSNKDFTTHEALSEIRERLAKIEAYSEMGRDDLVEIKKELTSLRVRVAAISATVAALVGGGMQYFG